MRKIVKPPIYLVILFSLFLGLFACGQKGPLYIEKPAQTEKSQ